MQQGRRFDLPVCQCDQSLSDFRFAAGEDDVLASFKQEALRLLEMSGKSVCQIENVWGITPGLLNKWKQRYRLHPEGRTLGLLVFEWMSSIQSSTTEFDCACQTLVQ